MSKETELKAPWAASYGDIPAHLDYFKLSMSAAVFKAAEADGDFTALTFMGRKITYNQLTESIDTVAKAFYNIGVRPGDRVMVCLPNVPQAIYSLYGLNRIGAVSSMVHPLSSVAEIEYDLNEACCDYAVTLDQFVDKFMDISKRRKMKKVVVASVSDELPGILPLLFKLTTERKYPRIADKNLMISWKDFFRSGKTVSGDYVVDKDPAGEAVVLFSGGTTGVSKGIRLSDDGFNAVALQTAAMSHENINHKKMLAAMPVFHGFGLGVCIHTMMVAGGTSILVPRFNAKSYAELIKKHRPNFIAGVPTLFEAICRADYLDGVDLSCLKGVFSGGDSLTGDLKKRFDEFLKSHNASIRIREGYGMTECVTACCLTPYNKEKAESIGIPYPDMYFRICAPGTNEELPYGTEGEICIAGPSLMIGYINHEEENATTLIKDESGVLWLHSGDLGRMDEDGFVYFRQRIKRMIVTSGYNVYPSQIENVLDSHEAVRMSCVIGVPDPYRMQKVKAFIVLNDGYEDSEELRDSIMQLCGRHIAKYALPREIEFRDELPKTLVGKVAYTQLS